ncbi:E3 ubiquitin-protein ligase bre1 [Penicillium cataractarum]|uniref:E3 ubiquitin protein ligase n=1 Tax=Penicillium cataractarum TaxID=2100454 RepID=A0A9W9RYX5_9EURO|nr:E3 ubiquitin-protein ligase bre1 [Penicillium cataractarum]KAJ5368250.1 E3 ubiquitin-protein ligase bre1 [Penicillium cataractarum]
MPAVEPPVLSSESGFVKMEDRKRPAAENNESAPPLKKQATTVNGGSKPHPDADMPWKDDLERFQKDAILRQMQEYKREKAGLESRLDRMSKAAAHHDNHLRAIDAWFRQLVDEVKTILGPSQESIKEPVFKSSLQFEDVDEFESHLKSRTEDIREIISHLHSGVANLSPDVTQLQDQLAKKLAEEKVTIARLEQTVAEKQQLEESLEAASLRYMVAEKKLDRARSVTVAKLEKQYLMGGQRPSSEGAQAKREDSSPANGGTPVGERSAELEEANNKLNAVSEKQKEQLQKLEAENAKLLEQITEIKIKDSKLTDDDYAHTDLFKQLRSQYDDVVKRINHLEATNVQLREEAEKYRSERNAYKWQLEEESKATIAEKEAALMRAENDLARIRNTRDELFADQQIRKNAQDQEKTAGVKLQELADAREARIAALESEIERLRLQIEGSKTVENVDEIPIDELRSKYSSLERQYSMLNTELASMQTAYKKFSTLASQKVTDLGALEEKMARLTAEKSKADQKYFAAMKSKEARDVEVRTLRMQNSKTSDIVSQLKESEAATRSLLSNMDKQVNETKEALNSALEKHRVTQQQLTESNIAVEGLKNQVSELKTLSTSKDSTLSNTSSALRQAETEIAGLKQSLSDTKKSLDNWKNKSLGNSSSEYEMLRTLALCTVCRRNFKNTVIKTCGHVFCKDCVEERLTSRSRKCPNCNRSFGSNDHMHITL